MTIQINTRLFIIIAIVLISVLLVWFWPHSLSGTYLSKNDDSISMIRLVETGDGKLTGQLEAITLDNLGTIKNFSASIEGATDNKSLNLKLSFSPLLADFVTASGTREWGGLILTFGILGESPKTRTYINSDLSQFQSASDALTAKSKKIIEERTAAELKAQEEQKKQRFLAAINQIIERMTNTNVQIDNGLQKFPIIEKQYHEITAKVQSYYDQTAKAPGNYYAVYRNQIIVAMNQGIIATNKLNNHDQAIKLNFHAAADPLLKESIQAEQSCPNKDGDINLSCQKLKDVGDIFKNKYQATVEALNNLDSTYQAQYNSQRALVERASQIK